MNNIDCKDLKVVYGMYDLCVEREQARWSLGYILEDFADIRKRYITLGFHLAEFRRCGYFQDFGFPSFEEFCEANIPMDKGSISRCINVYMEFGKREKESLSPDTPKMWIDDKYREYSYSQLVEMLPLDAKRRKMVTPDMSVTRIRELKKKCFVPDERIREFIECSVMSGIDSFARSEVLGKLVSLGDAHTCAFGDSKSYQFKPGKVAIDSYDEYYTFAQILDKYSSLPENKLVESVATSQPEQDEEAGLFPEYWEEDLDSEEFVSVLFSQITNVLKSFELGISDMERSGKQLSFRDMDGNSYSLLYRVSKKKDN